MSLELQDLLSGLNDPGASPQTSYSDAVSRIARGDFNESILAEGINFEHLVPYFGTSTRIPVSMEGRTVEDISPLLPESIYGIPEFTDKIVSVWQSGRIAGLYPTDDAYGVLMGMSFRSNDLIFYYDQEGTGMYLVAPRPSDYVLESMNTSQLSDSQRNIRRNIRMFLMVATPDELRRELQISLENGDTFRAECVRELMAEEGVTESREGYLQGLQAAADQAKLEFDRECIACGYSSEWEAFHAHPGGIFADVYEVWPESLVQAHKRYTDAIQTFYRERDGENGFLGESNSDSELQRVVKKIQEGLFWDMYGDRVDATYEIRYSDLNSFSGEVVEEFNTYVDAVAQAAVLSQAKFGGNDNFPVGVYVLPASGGAYRLFVMENGKAVDWTVEQETIANIQESVLKEDTSSALASLKNLLDSEGLYTILGYDSLSLETDDLSQVEYLCRLWDIHYGKALGYETLVSPGRGVTIYLTPLVMESKLREDHTQHVMDIVRQKLIPGVRVVPNAVRNLHVAENWGLSAFWDSLDGSTISADEFVKTDPTPEEIEAFWVGWEKGNQSARDQGLVESKDSYETGYKDGKQDATNSYPQNPARRGEEYEAGYDAGYASVTITESTEPEYFYIDDKDNMFREEASSFGEAIGILTRDVQGAKEGEDELCWSDRVRVTQMKELKEGEMWTNWGGMPAREKCSYLVYVLTGDPLWPNVESRVDASDDWWYASSLATDIANRFLQGLQKRLGWWCVQLCAVTHEDGQEIPLYRIYSDGSTDAGEQHNGFLPILEGWNGFDEEAAFSVLRDYRNNDYASGYMDALEYRMSGKTNDEIEGLLMGHLDNFHYADGVQDGLTYGFDHPMFSAEDLVESSEDIAGVLYRPLDIRLEDVLSSLVLEQGETMSDFQTPEEAEEFCRRNLYRFGVDALEPVPGQPVVDILPIEFVGCAPDGSPITSTGTNPIGKIYGRSHVVWLD